MFATLFALAVAALFTIVAVGIYNALVGLRVRADNAWADIDVQLKRRYDLIPNVVATVKGYAGHERETLEAVVEARSRAMSAQGQGPVERSQVEGALTMALGRLLALTEAYPQLRAVESFTSLQTTLAQVENDIQAARRYYNAVVRDLNTRIQVFPSNIVAGLFRFATRPFFEIQSAEREAPQVKF